MDYLNKRDQKYINKITRHHMKNITPLKKNPVFYNAVKLPVYCYKIKNVEDYNNYVEPSKRENDEWYIILGINKVHESHTLKEREYIYCNSKNIITKISDKLETNFSNFTSVFIVPKGSVSFYDIVEDAKLWIR